MFSVKSTFSLVPVKYLFSMLVRNSGRNLWFWLTVCCPDWWYDICSWPALTRQVHPVEQGEGEDLPALPPAIHWFSLSALFLSVFVNICTCARVNWGHGSHVISCPRFWHGHSWVQQGKFTHRISACKTNSVSCAYGNSWCPVLISPGEIMRPRTGLLPLSLCGWAHCMYTWRQLLFNVKLVISSCVFIF